MIGIIFSRDRAFQLDGMLRSLFLHCQDLEGLDLSVLYKTTSALHARQYAELNEAYGRRLRFVVERSFRGDLLELLHIPMQEPLMRARYILALWLGRWLGYPIHLPGLPTADETVFFLVDDNIFVRAFDLRDVLAALADQAGAIGFSLRLGMNTTHSYNKDRPQALPRFVQVSDLIVGFRWVGAEGDFGYPLEISSSVYRLRQLQPLLGGLPYANPNQLELQLARRARRFRHKTPMLLSYQQSVTFCNPVNRVQTLLDNRVGRLQAYSSQALAEQYEAGYRLDVEAYRDFVPSACHQEVELAFRKGL